MPVKVILHSFENAGPRQTAIANSACEIIEAALNNPNFNALVEGAQYRETRFQGASDRPRSIPISDIVGMIFAGAERGTEPDNEIDLRVKLDSFRRGTLGSTRPGQPFFRTSYWFINQCIKDDEPWHLAGHFIHEWLHVCGFFHWPDNNARHDVAYNVGNVVRQLGRGHSKLNKGAEDWLEQGICGGAQSSPSRDDKSADIDRTIQ